MNYTNEELYEAVRAINSMIKKSEKAQLKLTAGTWQHAMTEQSLKANYMARTLLNRALKTELLDNSPVSTYTDEEWNRALEALAAIIRRVEKILPQFKEGTPQHTLAVRRIKALSIASALIEHELNAPYRT